MADVTINITEYLQLLEAVRELPAIHKRLRHMQDQLDAQRGLILEVSQKCVPKEKFSLTQDSIKP